MVVVVTGKINAESVLKELKLQFSDLPQGKLLSTSLINPVSIARSENGVGFFAAWLRNMTEYSTVELLGQLILQNLGRKNIRVVFGPSESGSLFCFTGYLRELPVQLSRISKECSQSELDLAKQTLLRRNRLRNQSPTNLGLLTGVCLIFGIPSVENFDSSIKQVKLDDLRKLAAKWAAEFK